MAEPTLSDVMALLAHMRAEQAKIELEQRQQTALLTALVEGQQIMATNLETLQAALDALNTTTTQEATLLQADTAKLDVIQTLITSILSTTGVPQSVLDQAAAIQAQLTGVVASTTAQAARLDQLATDPRNPVPTPPPVA
jgi:uncharacterized protein (UPF0147 family)